MSIKNKILVTAAAGLALGVSSCKKYLDVNTNPNVAQQGTVATVLPAAQLYLGSAIGTEMQINGAIWAQQWTQAPGGKQYQLLEQFAPKQDFYDASWKNLYAAGQNFYQVYNMADSQHKSSYKAISMLMRAYAFQAVTDGWGDVPFSEALRGSNSKTYALDPHYDAQRTVYMGILGMIDSASGLISTADPSHPGVDDIIYGGDMSKWQKFANTLKLRVLTRMSGIDPLYARPRIDTMFRRNMPFIGEGDDAVINYGTGMAGSHPLYAELSASPAHGMSQLAASKTVVDEMNDNNDPRAAVFFTSLPGYGVAGVKQGEYDIETPSNTYSMPSRYVGAAAGNAPVVLLSSWESYFLQAEAFARGITTGDDMDAFFKGIHASFNFYGNALVATGATTASSAYTSYVTGVSPAPAGYWATYPSGGTAEEKVRHIITQKYFAMAGNQGFEAWTEWRRTGYPDFLIDPRNSLIGTEKPARFLYPASEHNNANYPGLVPVTTHVWWDKL